MTKLVSKKVIVPAAVALAAAGIALAFMAAPQAMAAAAFGQEMKGSGEGGSMPRINGTVNAGQEMRDFINDNLKVTLAQASETAAGQAGGEGVTVGGHLGIVQGYLVYKLFAVNPEDQTGRMVIVDAGNGEVLYTSESIEMGSFGHPGFAGPGWGKGHGFGGGWHQQQWMR